MIQRLFSDYRAAARALALALARTIALLSYQNLSVVVGLNCAGALLLILATVSFVAAFMTAVFHPEDMLVAAGLMALSIFLQWIGHMIYLGSRTSLLMRLINLPDAPTGKEAYHAQFCVRSLADPREMDFITGWYDEVPKIVDEAKKRLAEL
jgi:hypothetical protein